MKSINRKENVEPDTKQKKQSHCECTFISMESGPASPLSSRTVVSFNPPRREGVRKVPIQVLKYVSKTNPNLFHTHLLL